MTLECKDGRFIYTVRTTCGRPSECSVRVGEKGYDTPIDWNEIPFLVQQHFESRIQENLDSCPPGLWR